MNQSVDIERLRALRRELLRREEDIRASRVSTQREVEHQLHTIRQEHRQSYVRESLREVEHSMRAYCQSVREQEEAIHKKANVLTSLIQMYEEEAYREKRGVQGAFARMRNSSDKGGGAEEVERPLWSERISGWMEEGIGWLNKGWEAFAAMCQEMFEGNIEHSVEAIYKHGIGDIPGRTLERIKGNLEGYYDQKALEEGMPVDTMTLRLYEGLMKDFKELGIEEGDRIALLGLSKEEGMKALELLYVMKAHEVQWEKEQRQQTMQMEDKFRIMTEVKGESNRYAFYQWLKTHAEQGEGIDLKALSAEEEAMLWKEIGRTSEYLVEAMESYLTREGVDWEQTLTTGMDVSDRWHLSPEMVSQLTGQYREAFEEDWHKILEDQEKLESLREEFAGYREKQKQGLYGQEYEAKKDIQGNCYLYGVDVDHAKRVDMNGLYEMDSRYNDFGPIFFRELGYTFEIPEEDIKNMTPAEYANFMGPIWEISQKNETRADDLEDIRTVITILSAFSMYMGVEGVASAVALDTGLDTADTAVSIISGDRAGTILGILSIALPALMDDAAKGGKIAAKDLSNGIEGLSEAERVKLYKALEVEGITDIRKLDVDQEVLTIYSKEATYEIRMMDGVVEGTGNLVFKTTGEYFDFINDVGKRADLINQQKFDKIQEAYQALETKGNTTIVSDMKFLTSEGFDVTTGRMKIDWPEKMGFDINSIQSINRTNQLPSKWDRVGGMGGENFTTLPSGGTPYSYDQRAIPYVENASARHTGTFNNDSYYDVIDAIKSKDLNKLTDIVRNNGMPEISAANFDDMVADYTDFQKRVLEQVGNIDATYGLKGVAAPWKSSATGKILLTGGAEQIVTPLSGYHLIDLGVLKQN